MVHYEGALNLPAPDDDDPVGTWPQTFREMCIAVGVAVGGGIESTNTVTASSGWAVTASYLRLMPAASLLYIDLTLERTGSTINAGGNGNAGAIDMCRLPSDFRPTRNHRCTVFTGAQGDWGASILTSTPGMLRLLTGPPSGSIPSGTSGLRVTTVASFS